MVFYLEIKTRKMSSSKFHAKSTALEVIEGHDLAGYETIVTGGASGIGIETVRALAKAGARVIIGARDLVRAEPIAQSLRTETGSNKIELEQLDLASLKSVRNFVERFLEKKRPLHILINNAGINMYFRDSLILILFLYNLRNYGMSVGIY